MEEFNVYLAEFQANGDNGAPIFAEHIEGMIKRGLYTGEMYDMTPPYVLALQDTNIRSGPGKKFPKLSGNSILYAGQIAKYEETDEDSGWYGVTTRYGPGFISCRAELTKLVL